MRKKFSPERCEGRGGDAVLGKGLKPLIVHPEKEGKGRHSGKKFRIKVKTNKLSAQKIEAIVSKRGLSWTKNGLLTSTRKRNQREWDPGIKSVAQGLCCAKT